MQRKRPSPQERGAARSAMGRAMRYLSHYRRQALLPYLFLVIAILSQLAVPRMVRNVIDAVSQGVIAKNVLAGLEQIPAGFTNQALPRILEYLKLPADWTLDQLTAQLTFEQTDAPRALVMAAIAIVMFASLRGVFAFLQAIGGDATRRVWPLTCATTCTPKSRTCPSLITTATRPGQLMVRATDDVEKVRLFIGQGLLQLVGAVLLLVGTLIILFTTNARLTLVVLPILPVALILFMIFGTISQPLFTKVQIRTFGAEHRCCRKTWQASRWSKPLRARKSEQAKFDRVG